MTLKHRYAGRGKNRIVWLTPNALLLQFLTVK